MRPSSKLAREFGRAFSLEFWYRQLYTRLIRLVSRPFTKADGLAFDLDDLTAEKTLVGFISFAPKGFRPDTVRLLKLMTKSGRYKICLVSNCPLTDADKAILSDLHIAYAETQNKGYDFGAYQKFVLGQNWDEIEFDRLVLMNDSFITPLANESLEHLHPSGNEDFYGLYYGHEKRPKNLHICSFFLSFSKKTALSDTVQDYFAKYRPSNNRIYTIRYGEVGLSKAVITSGFSHGVACQKADLRAAVKAAELERLQTLLKSDVCQSLIRTAHIPQDLLDTQGTFEQLINKCESLSLAFLYSDLCGANLVKLRDLREQSSALAWFSARFPIVADLFPEGRS